MTQTDDYSNLAKIFSVPEAAWLWCSRDPKEYKDAVAPYMLDSQRIQDVKFSDAFPDVQDRVTLLINAMIQGEVSVRDSTGERRDSMDDLFPDEAPHVQGVDIKTWLEKKFPKDRPEFLFETSAVDTNKLQELIAVLLQLIQGKLPGCSEAAIFEHQHEIRGAIVDAYKDQHLGFGESTLNHMFAEANKALKKKT